MPLTLPPGKRMAVALTFDVDAHSNWLGSLGRLSARLPWVRFI